MLKWRQVVIWPAVFILVVDISTSAHCAVAHPSRSITVVNDVAEPDNKSKRSTDVSSRVVARPANNAKLVQPDVVRSTVQARSVQNRASTRAVVARSSTNANIAETTNQPGIVLMKEQGNMLSFCKDQYTKCMDNFCNVLDDKLGRCSCSANLKNYTETEEGLKQATEELQNVAQQIQYIGLTVNQLESLFTQTEAELELQSISDNSQLKNSLDKIKAMIVEVQSGRASSNSSSGLSFDVNGLLDFSLDSNGLDLYSILGMSGSNTNSISNQRGENLYKTATDRCRSSVLDTCQAQGIDISMITNAYDLEIDKACIAYERSLTDANNEMLATIRNANSLLQRARLTVASQKDSYDMRQCIKELDSCMQDDFVCGRDYDNCLDPTGKFIVKGNVISVLDQDEMMMRFWGVADPSGDRTFITKNSQRGIIRLLLDKIGNPIKNTGLCNAVLNKCQSQWKNEKSDDYDILNQTTLTYLETVIPKIVKHQKELIVDFMGDCKQSVYSCMSSVAVNGVSPRPTQSVISFLNPRISACSTVINSCETLLNISTKELLADWITQNICGEYDFDNDVCSLIALKEKNCWNDGNLWIDGVCQDSTAYYTKLASTYEELPSYCWPGVPVNDWPGTGDQWYDCVDRVAELRELLKDEPKPIPPYEYGYTWGPSPNIFPLCTEIGWLPVSEKDNAELFCIAKGCYLNGTTRCISGYTRIFDPCGSGFGTADNFICCPPDKTDECVQQYCADE